MKAVSTSINLSNEVDSDITPTASVALIGAPAIIKDELGEYRLARHLVSPSLRLQEITPPLSDDDIAGLWAMRVLSGLIFTILGIGVIGLALAAMGAAP